MMLRVFSVGATMVNETWFATYLFFCRSKLGKMEIGMLLIALSKIFSSIRQVTLDISHQSLAQIKLRTFPRHI